MPKFKSERIRPVILCGGQGTRLWPLSRASFPKQFARVFSEKSLFQETLDLVSDRDLFSAPIIVGSEAFEHVLRSHLKEIDIKDADLILESEGRNTTAAIALAALTSDIDEHLLVLPSDHHIVNKKQFEKDVFGLRENIKGGSIGLFGIRPEHASTDYGYIEAQIGYGSSQIISAPVKEFHEKPERKIAKKYVASGCHFWNSGIFLFRRDSIIEELKLHANHILSLCKDALSIGRVKENKHYTHPETYALVPSIPIDISIMEVTGRAIVRRAKFDWIDMGSWKSFASTCERDVDGNSATGPVYLEECKENLIHAEGKLVTAIGLEGHAIIDTEDALLIMPKDRAGELSSLVKKMKKDGINEAHHHAKVRRPWGSYRGIHQGEEHQVKHIIVKPNEKLSYQFHYYRSEHWIVVKGSGIVTLGDKEQLVQQNDSVYIPVGTAHRLHNPNAEELHLIEVQYGDYLGEDDIVRLEDVYGRVETRTHKIRQGETV